MMSSFSSLVVTVPCHEKEKVMASATLEKLLVGEDGDKDLATEIRHFEQLAAYIETENADCDGACQPAELPGQMQKIRGDQVKNNAGGYVFQVNDLNRIRRFLILGTEGGTYYSSEKKLTMDNVKAMCDIIDKGKGPLLLSELVQISLDGRAPKQDPTLLALALCARYKVVDTTRGDIHNSVMKKYEGKALTDEDNKKIVDEVEKLTKERLDENEKRKVNASGFEQQAPQEAYDDYQRALHRMAFRAVLKVCRIPTHLFTFIDYCQLVSGQTGAKKSSKGWGRAMRSAITQWYFSKSPAQLSMMITKYQQRSGFSHRDVMRLCHIRPRMSMPKTHPYWHHHREYDFLFSYIISGSTTGLKRVAEGDGATEAKKPKKENKKPETEEQRKKREITENKRMEKEMMRMKLRETNKETMQQYKLEEAPFAEGTKAAKLIYAFEEMKQIKNESEAADLIGRNGLVREHVPSELLNSKVVWEALLKDMPMTAMIRNLGKMAAIEMITDIPENKKNIDKVIASLTDEEALHKARIHPISVLMAMAVYKSGAGFRGKLNWKPTEKITNALEKAFIMSFKNVTPTNKRYCLALDVSGSMGASVLNSVLECREAAAGMSMVLLKTEPKVETVAFCDKLTPLNFNKNSTVQQMLNTISGMSFGATDCALPMLWAAQKKKEFDVFVVYTDSETWFGDVHPFKALQQYREKMKIPDAKLVVMGMTATEFTIADPQDPGMLDICGFDSAVPEILKEFVMGNI